MLLNIVIYCSNADQHSQLSPNPLCSSRAPPSDAHSPRPPTCSRGFRYLTTLALGDLPVLSCPILHCRLVAKGKGKGKAKGKGKPHHPLKTRLTRVPANTADPGPSLIFNLHVRHNLTAFRVLSLPLSFFSLPNPFFIIFSSSVSPSSPLPSPHSPCRKPSWLFPMPFINRHSLSLALDHVAN